MPSGIHVFAEYLEQHPRRAAVIFLLHLATAPSFRLDSLMSETRFKPQLLVKPRDQ